MTAESTWYSVDKFTTLSWSLQPQHFVSSGVCDGCERCCPHCRTQSAACWRSRAGTWPAAPQRTFLLPSCRSTHHCWAVFNISLLYYPNGHLSAIVYSPNGYLSTVFSPIGTPVLYFILPMGTSLLYFTLPRGTSLLYFTSPIGIFDSTSLSQWAPFSQSVSEVCQAGVKQCLQWCTKASSVHDRSGKSLVPIAWLNSPNSSFFFFF